MKKNRLPNVLEATLIQAGVGLVQTVIQEPGAYGQHGLGRAAEERFAKSLNPRHKIQYWAWPATLMRAVTTAFAESEHFETGKVAVSGGSKNGASPSMAILHDERMTAIHASVSPIWDSPLRLCDPSARAVHEASGGVQRGFSGGHFGPNFNLAAIKAGRTWEQLEAFMRDISDDVFISRNHAALRKRGVEMLFHPGTHDMVAYDLAWGGKHHPEIPVYLGANTGHGLKGHGLKGHGLKGHPQLEYEENREAFLLRHFQPDLMGPLLTPPSVETQVEGDTLKVAVRFPPDSGEESGRIWWIYDREPDGSPKYLSELIPDENSAEMHFDTNRGVWTAELKLDSKASRIDFFTNHKKDILYPWKSYPTYLSSPYTRVTLRKE